MDSEVVNKQVNYKKQATVPVVVQQVVSCDTPTWKLFGRHAQIIYLLGIIRNISSNPPEQISFEIEDHTGVLHAIISCETPETFDEHLINIHTKIYSQIFAIYRGPATPISVLKVFPINDANAVTNHLLNAMNSRLEAEANLRRQLDAATSAGEALMYAMGQNEDCDKTEESGRITNDLQQKCLNLIKIESYFIGIAKNALLNHFPPLLGDQVLQAVEHLINQGLIYYMQDGHLKAL